MREAKPKDAGFEDIDFREGDAEQLPFADAAFDVVVSRCGHMFAPDQPKVAAELARVTRPAGRVVFLAWTPEGGLGGWFRITNKHVPPPAGLASPFNWADREKVGQLLSGASVLRQKTSGSCFRRATGRPFAPLLVSGGNALSVFRSELLSYLEGYRAKDGKVRWGREYLITRAVRV